MTQTRVRPANVTNELSTAPTQWKYGPDLIDQWKARAFQQRPGGQTPCCGYEEEVNNWGGSSMLMGVRAGPVRVIRSTWGSDSATNNIRTAIFYRDDTGQYGTFVDRFTVKQVTPGAAYSVVTTPYYRDGSCFDDGTGTDPGLHVAPAASDPSVDSAGQPRACWTPADGDPAATQPADHFYHGDIGTHGVHIMLIADSDNARTTEPVDEISAEQRRVILPGLQGNVGEQYGRGFEKPLVALATPMG